MFFILALKFMNVKKRNTTLKPTAANRFQEVCNWRMLRGTLAFCDHLTCSTLEQVLGRYLE